MKIDAREHGVPDERSRVEGPLRMQMRGGAHGNQHDRLTQDRTDEIRLFLRAFEEGCLEKL